MTAVRRRREVLPVVLLCVASAMHMVQTATATPEADDDLLASIPRYTPPPGTTAPTVHSGYLHLEGGGKSFFYVLVDAAPRSDAPADEAQAARERLIVWLNGGPGCSSLRGLFEEHGPFFSDWDGSQAKLRHNPESWHQLGAVLYLESPTGVGFSKSTHNMDYHNNDATTAQDNYAALQAFMAMYPEYQAGSVVLASESYGGHYTPQFAKAILDGNERVEGEGFNAAHVYISLVGFAVGNAYTIPGDDETTLSFLHEHGMIPDGAFDAIESTCNGNLACYWQSAGYDVGTCSSSCRSAINAAVHAAGTFNSYHIYAMHCNPSASRARSTASDAGGAKDRQLRAVDTGGDDVDDDEDVRDRAEALRKASGRRLAEAGVAADAATTDVPAQLERGNAECVDTYTGQYLNDESVKEAWNADTSITWHGCAPFGKFQYPMDVSVGRGVHVRVIGCVVDDPVAGGCCVCLGR